MRLQPAALCPDAACTFTSAANSAPGSGVHPHRTYCTLYLAVVETHCCRATVHVKDEEYLLHQVEEICKKADFASLDSIFGDGGWSWEDLDNPEPFKRRAAERRDQLIKKLAPTGGRFTADSNEKLTACLHDYVRPTTKDGEPQKAEWWPLVLEVHTHMTLVRYRYKWFKSFAAAAKASLQPHHSLRRAQLTPGIALGS